MLAENQQNQSSEIGEIKEIVISSSKYRPNTAVPKSGDLFPAYTIETTLANRNFDFSRILVSYKVAYIINSL